MDRKYHGGIDKACYCFSADQYPKWTKLYTDLVWQYGMFGENLTIENCNEKEIFIGNQYKVGDVIIEVSEPREPCFKLGIRFGSQKVVKQFLNQPYCGFYVRVLQTGLVKPNDELTLVKKVQQQFSVARIYHLLFHSTVLELNEINRALESDFISKTTKNGLLKRKNILDN